jgi:hypothetical protein
MYTLNLVDDYYPIILSCYSEDDALEQFSRNVGSYVDRAKSEYECLRLVNDTFEFFTIIQNGEMIGYFGKETINDNEVLTTFFIRNEYRSDKNAIWKFIISHFDSSFYSGLFCVNYRAIRFYKKMGGKIVAEIVAEDKPAYVFKFGE